MKSSNSFLSRRLFYARRIRRLMNSRVIQSVLAIFIVAVSLHVNSQQAFKATQISINWDENPNPSVVNTELGKLNDAINDALTANEPASDFCFELETVPADILEFDLNDVNCAFGGSATNNGFNGQRSSNAGRPFSLVAGSVPIDYESQIRVALTITAHVTSHTPTGRVGNTLSIAIDVDNHDEQPELRSGRESTITRFLTKGGNDSFKINILDYFVDPERRSVKISDTAENLCEGNVGDGDPWDPTPPSSKCDNTHQLDTRGNTASLITTSLRGPVLEITADGPGIVAAGTYFASLHLFVYDGTSQDVQKRFRINIAVKNGANNPPNFKGNATGFATSVDEQGVTDQNARVIGPSPAGAWDADDLDGDIISYSLVDGNGHSQKSVSVGSMLIEVPSGSHQNITLSAMFLDYESPDLKSDKSFTVTLRASDGWDHVDIPISVEINNINELYLHSDSDPFMRPVMPTNVSVIEGDSVTLDLSDYVTDPENDTLVYSAFAYLHTGLVNISGDTLTINGSGTSSTMSTLTDTIQVEVTDGQITETRDINVRVRNMNETPRFEPAGVLVVGGTIDENVPIGTAVSGFARYADSDSTASEISVSVSTPAFVGVVDPLMDNGVICTVPSTSCVAQVGRIALLTATSMNFEAMAQHDVKLSLYDGWAQSDPNADVTMRVSVNDRNDPPIASGSIKNLTVSVNGVESFDASRFFSDEDQGDRVIVNATSKRPDIASVSVAGAAEVIVTGESVGEARIELTATDIAGESATHIFAVEVKANQAPVAQSSVFDSALPENSELRLNDIVDVPLTGLFTDPDGDAISVTVDTLNEDILLVTLTGGGETATLVPRGLGTTDLVFTATDTADNTTTETRKIHVVSRLSSENEPPVLDQAALESALPNGRSMVVGSVHVIQIASVFSDSEGGSLTINMSTSNVKVLDVKASDAMDEWTLHAIGEGSADLSIAATDNGKLRTETTVSITVVPDKSGAENQAPVLDIEAFDKALPPNRSIVLRRFFIMDLQGLFTDPDGDDFSLTAESSDSAILRVSLRQNGNSAALTARAIGDADLIITATDSDGDSSEARATISVVDQDANRAPEIDRTALTAALPDNNTIPETEYFELQLDQLFHDPDGSDDIVHLGGSSSDSDVLDVSVDDSHRLEALAFSPGEVVLSLVARDKAGAEAIVNETITVTAATASSLAIESQSFDRSAPLTLALNELTQDPKTLSSITDLQVSVDDPSILSTSLSGPTLTLRALKQGRTFIKLRSVDTSERKIRSVFYVDVVNAAPTLTEPLPDQTATRLSDLSIDVRSMFEDADGDSFHVSAHVSDDSIAQIDLTDDSLVIEGLHVGECVVTLMATDIHGAETVASFNLSIENIGPRVVAQAGPIHLQVGGEPYELSFASWFLDDDGDLLSYTTTLESPNVVKATESAVGMTFTPLMKGNTRLTATAFDTYGSSASVTTHIVVGDDKLKEIAAKSLASFGRSMLSGISATIETRVNLNRVTSDFDEESQSFDTFELGSSSSMSNIGAASNNQQHVDQLAWTSLTDSVRDGRSTDTSNIHSSAPFENSFSINLGSGDTASAWFLWSNMGRQVFSGDAYNGSISNSYVGVDTQLGDVWVFGITAARHHGESEYSYGSASQEMDLTLDQLIPYMRYAPSDDTQIWSTVGFGDGELATTVVGADDSTSGLKSRLAILGGRHHIADSGHFEFALRGDVATIELATTSGDSASDGISAKIQRTRVGIDSAFVLELTPDISLTPFGQLNLRSDMGDSDAGSGFEFTGGMKLAYRALAIELTGRRFDVTGNEPYSERGVAMTATFNPSTGGSGFSASISPRWGTDVRQNDVLWRQQTEFARNVYSRTSLDSSSLNTNAQLDATLSYGLLISNERFLITPFLDFSGDGDARRRTQFGAQLRKFENENSSFSAKFVLGRTGALSRTAEEFIGVTVDVGF